MNSENALNQSAPIRCLAERSLRFGLDDAQKAGDEWGFNCGPGAICAVMNMTPWELRPHMGDFENKRYTNPTLMWEILGRLGARWRMVYTGNEPSAVPNVTHGLMRVQWNGPWTSLGVPMRARYRHTHWVGIRNGSREIFDVNAMCVGGWLAFEEWSRKLVPWLCAQVVPHWGGQWWPTHVLEVKPNVSGQQRLTEPEQTERNPENE